ncbi:MAG: AmmeMemoRadiSam system radical SAM enzyme [Candidatus Sigynarchaeota archaeon]
MPGPFVKKAALQERIGDGICKCLTCEHRCQIREGRTGICGTRYNFKNDIYTITYGCAASLSANPIEKKPLYHFFPGTTAITIGAFGCNFKCFWCQNHAIAHPGSPVPDLVSHSRHVPPDALVKMAATAGCKGTSISFNEPTLSLEFSVDVFSLARKAGLYNTFVTNGYMTRDALALLARSGLDAMSINIKGDAGVVREHCGADVEICWRNAISAKKMGIHVEIVTLVIEGLNSNDNTINAIAARIARELGRETPFHLTRFFPARDAMRNGFDHETPVQVLISARERAIDAGLKHVYIGNLRESKYDDTICPGCSRVVIKRCGFSILKKQIDDDGNCLHCGHPICTIHSRARARK